MSYIDKLLGANEKILCSTRRHLFVLFGQILKELLILIVLIVGFFALKKLRPEHSFPFEIAFGILGLVVLVSILIDVLRWTNEGYLVTNRRVIHTSGIFSKKVLDSSLNKINDVILMQSWFGRIFDYGTMKILTASDEVISFLDRIARPIEFKQAMLNAKEQLEPASVPGPAVSPSATQLLEELSQMRARNMISEEEYQEKRKEILRRM